MNKIQVPEPAAKSAEEGVRKQNPWIAKENLALTSRNWPIPEFRFHQVWFVSVADMRPQGEWVVVTDQHNSARLLDPAEPNLFFQLVAKEALPIATVDEVKRIMELYVSLVLRGKSIVSSQDDLTVSPSSLRTLVREKLVAQRIQIKPPEFQRADDGWHVAFTTWSKSGLLEFWSVLISSTYEGRIFEHKVLLNMLGKLGLE